MKNIIATLALALAAVGTAHADALQDQLDQWDHYYAKKAAKEAAEKREATAMDSARVYRSSSGGYQVHDRYGNKLLETMPTYRSRK